MIMLLKPSFFARSQNLAFQAALAGSATKKEGFTRVYGQFGYSRVFCTHNNQQTSKSALRAKSQKSSWEVAAEKYIAQKSTSKNVTQEQVSNEDSGAAATTTRWSKIKDKIKRLAAEDEQRKVLGQNADKPINKMEDGIKPRKDFDRSERPSKFYEGGEKPSRVYQGGDKSRRVYQGDDRPTNEFEDGTRPSKDFERYEKPRKFHGGGDKPYEREGRRKDSYNQPRTNDRWAWKKKDKVSTIPQMTGEAVYGLGPVLAALSIARREFYALYVQETITTGLKSKKRKDKEGIGLVLHLAEKLGLPVKETPKHDLNMIVDSRPHQGFVLDASPLDVIEVVHLDPAPKKPPPSRWKVGDEESSEEEDRNSNAHVWVALDEITDPQNFGAVLRSAYFFGATGVVVCTKNSAPPSGVVSKASSGALELMELRSCPNMMNFLLYSSRNGWRVLGASADNSKAIPLSSIEADVPTILVMGSEGSGLRPVVVNNCDQLVSIPGADLSPIVPVGARDEDFKLGRRDFNSFFQMESLNVSVATGIMLYHLTGFSRSSSQVQTEDGVLEESHGS